MLLEEPGRPCRVERPGFSAVSMDIWRELMAPARRYAPAMSRPPPRTARRRAGMLLRCQLTLQMGGLTSLPHQRATSSLPSGLMVQIMQVRTCGSVLRVFDSSIGFTGDPRLRLMRQRHADNCRCERP